MGGMGEVPSRCSMRARCCCPLDVPQRGATSLAWHPSACLSILIWPHLPNIGGPNVIPCYRSTPWPRMPRGGSRRSPPGLVPRPPLCDLDPCPDLCIARERPDPALWGEPSSPERYQAAFPMTPAWLCHPQTLPKPPSQEEGQGGGWPPAPTHRPRHRPSHNLSLTRPEEFQGHGASPERARSSLDTVLRTSPHGGLSPRWLVPTAGISAANWSGAPKSIGVQGPGAGGCQLDPE